MARALLTQAAPLVADATEQGLADLTHAAQMKLGTSCSSHSVRTFLLRDQALWKHVP